MKKKKSNNSDIYCDFSYNSATYNTPHQMEKKKSNNSDIYCDFSHNSAKHIY